MGALVLHRHGVPGRTCVPAGAGPACGGSRQPPQGQWPPAGPALLPWLLCRKQVGGWVVLPPLTMGSHQPLSLHRPERKQAWMPERTLSARPCGRAHSTAALASLVHAAAGGRADPLWLRPCLAGLSPGWRRRRLQLLCLLPSWSSAPTKLCEPGGQVTSLV